MQPDPSVWAALCPVWAINQHSLPVSQWARQMCLPEYHQGTTTRRKAEKANTQLDYRAHNCLFVIFVFIFRIRKVSEDEKLSCLTQLLSSIAAFNMPPPLPKHRHCDWTCNNNFWPPGAAQTTVDVEYLVFGFCLLIIRTSISFCLGNIFPGFAVMLCK